MTQLSNSKTAEEIKFNYELHLLKLLGIQPNLETCVHCGTDLWQKESGRIPAPKFSVPCQLDASLGGIRCPKCCISNSYSVGLHAGSLAFLRERQTRLGMDSAIRPTQNNLKELDQAFSLYFNYFFGRNIKSHTLLMENSWKN